MVACQARFLSFSTVDDLKLEDCTSDKNINEDFPCTNFRCSVLRQDGGGGKNMYLSKECACLVIKEQRGSLLQSHSGTKLINSLLIFHFIFQLVRI